MSQSYLVQEAPPMWWLEPVDPDAVEDDVVGGGDVLRLGDHAVRLDDIASYKVNEVAERDVDGLMLNAAVFFVAASVFLIGVLQFGWLERFLLGFVFLTVLGVASLLEVLGLNRISYLQLTLFTRSGRMVQFTSVDPRDVGRLTGFLSQIVRH
ncbi:MAG: hypothetical protein KJ587_12625 [Alphaproteobacteria bacterium]|nr:hypothetical protein [Alphaproteobacteria bacterium]